MSSWKNLRTTVKEIIDLSSKSATLADPKSKLFCQQFLKQASNDRSELIKSICSDHGLKTDRIFNSVNEKKNFLILNLKFYTRSTF